MAKKVIHMGMSIMGTLENYDNAQLASIFNKPGQKHHGKTYRKELQERYDRGERVLPMGDCDKWDPVTGCPGHECPYKTMTPEIMNDSIERDIFDVHERLQAVMRKLVGLEEIYHKWKFDHTFEYAEAGKMIDVVIELAARVSDRAMGKEYLPNGCKGYTKTKTCKVRKALGYTYP